MTSSRSLHDPSDATCDLSIRFRHLPRECAVRVLFAAIAGAYVLASGAIWSAQTKILFHPGRNVDVTRADLGVKFDNITLPLDHDPSILGAASGTLFAYLPLRLIVTERFDSISKISSIHLPRLIMQGEADRMLLPRMARSSMTRRRIPNNWP